MALSGELFLPMVGMTVQSFTTDTDWDRTRLLIDDADWDTANIAFTLEIVGHNTDTVARDVSIVDTGGTVYATITIPANTAAVDRVRLRSSAFSLNAGATTYLIRVKLTGSISQVNVTMAGIHCVLTNATRAVPRFLLTGVTDVGTSQNSFIDRNNSASFLDLDINKGGRFLLTKANYGDTVAVWGMGACVRASSGGDIDIAAVNFTDSTQVATLGQKAGNSSPVYEEFTWAESAANFDDGDEIWIQMERSTGGGFTEISRAELFVKLTSLQDTETHFPLPHGDIGILLDRNFTENRLLFTEGSYDSIDDVIWEVSAGIASGDSFNVRLIDAGTNDSGTSGSAISSLFFDGATTRKRNTGLSLSDTDRHFAFADETVTASLALGLGRLILVISGFPVVTQNIPVETLALADAPERPVSFDAELLDASDALALTEAPAAPAVFDLETLPVPDESLALVDSPLAPVVSKALVLQAADTLGLADSASFLKGPDFSPLSLTIAEMKLDQGTQFLAGKGVRHPARYYRGRVGSYGRVVRSIPLPVGVPQIGDAEIELVDTDAEFRKLFAEVPPQNREITLKVGPEEESERLFDFVFTGEITGASFPPGLAKLSLRDKSWRFLDQETQPLLTRRNFAPSATEPLFSRNLRQRTEGSFIDKEVFSPIVHGQVRATGDQIGAMNAVRINDTRWNLTRTAIPHAAISVFRKQAGEDEFTAFSGFTVVEETKTIDDIEYTFTHIDIPPEEDDEGTEVRWTGDGMTLDGTKEGAISRNGAVNIRLYLEQIVRKAPGELNSASFTETAELLDAVETGGPSLGLLFDGATIAASTHGQVLTRMLQSCGCVLFLDKRGLISITYISQVPVNPPVLDDVQDIYLKSETHSLPDPVYTDIDMSYARNFATQDWGAEDPLGNPAALAAFGREERFALNIWFVRDAFTAAKLASDLLTWTDTESMRITFTIPGHRRTSLIELGQSNAITSYSGIDQSGGGYIGRPFLVIGTSFDLDTKDLQVTAISRVQPIEGQGFVDGVVTNDARFGPHYFASANFFAVFRDKADDTRLFVQGSSNWGQSWSEVDSANAPSYSSDILAHDSTPDRRNAKKLLIVTQTLDGVVDFHQFDMAARKWDVTKRNVWPSVSGFANLVSNQYMAQVERSRNSSRIAVFFFRQSDPNASGQFGGIRGRTAWAYSDDEGLSWTSPADIGQNTGEQSPFGELYDYQGGRVAAALSGGFHFWYTRLPGDFTRSTEDSYHRTARSSGSLTGEVRWHLSSLSFFAAPYNYGLIGEEIDEDGKLQLHVPIKGDLGGDFTKAESSNQMSSQLNLALLGDGVLAQGASESFGNYPMARIQFIKGEAHYMAAHRRPGSFDGWSFHNTTGGFVDGADRIGPFYDESGQNLNNAGFLLIDLVGQLWIATFQESRDTLQQFYFTLWPLTRLPRPESFDTAALEQAVADQGG